MTGAKRKNQIGPLPGIVIFAAFCALAVWIWVPPSGSDTARPSATPASTMGSRVEEGIQTVADLIPVTTERPLFHASRRPVPPDAPAPAPVAPVQTISLVGILSEDDTQIALVRISGSTELYRVDAGGQLGPWKILMIGENFVQVSKDEGDPFLLTIGE